MSPLDVAAGLAVLAGALLQSAVGFGFSLACAPLVFAATTPEHAVTLLTLLGIEVNVLTLATEGRRPRPLPAARAILLWAVPGMFLGIAVLRAADKTSLQVLVSLTVLATLAARRAERRAPRWATPFAGVAAGALQTSTSAAGPPLVLLLRGRSHAPAAIRDTLTVVFFAFGVAALAVLAVTGAFELRVSVLALVPVVFAGHLLGRPVFRHLERRAYEPVLTGVLLASAVAGLLVVLL